MTFIRWEYYVFVSKILLPNIRNVYNADGAHIQKSLYGAFLVGGIDTNYNIVFLAMAWYYENYYENT